ncbi:MAG: RNA polymerase sigma factor [Solirubrobacterales bacterium]
MTPPPAVAASAGPAMIDCPAPVEADAASEETILRERLVEGDPEALRDVYRLYSRPVFGYLVRFMGDRAAAEDVQQQIFLEVWEKAARFDPDRGSLLTWIMTIARSRAIDQARKKVPEPRDPERTARLIDSEPPRGDGIDEVVETWQFSQILARLPEEEAALLRYRFQGELSQTEIATKTGIPLGTVKARMVSALERLRRMMEAEA